METLYKKLRYNYWYTKSAFTTISREVRIERMRLCDTRGMNQTRLYFIHLDINRFQYLLIAIRND